MGYKLLYAIFAFFFLSGCVASDCRVRDFSSHYSQVVKLGKEASLTDLALIVEDWDSIKNSIIAYDRRTCVKGMELNGLVFINVLPKSRLSFTAVDMEGKPRTDEVKKIISLSFLDPCGNTSSYSTNPEWVVAELKNAQFKVIDFVQIME